MTNKVYIGIDPSFTNTGIVAIDGNLIVSREFATPKRPGDGPGEGWRLSAWLANAYNIMDWGWNMVIGIEVPMGNHRGAAVKVDRLFGYAMGQFHSHDIWPSTYTPGQIKKFFTGSGHCHVGKGGSKEQKKMMVWFANNAWDFPCTSHDIADAFAIAKLTQYLDDGRYEL